MFWSKVYSEQMCLANKVVRLRIILGTQAFNNIYVYVCLIDMYIYVLWLVNLCYCLHLFVHVHKCVCICVKCIYVVLSCVGGNKESIYRGCSGCDLARACLRKRWKTDRPISEKGSMLVSMFKISFQSSRHLLNHDGVFFYKMCKLSNFQVGIWGEGVNLISIFIQVRY